MTAQQASQAEWHIASVVVYSARKRTLQIAEALTAVPHAEVHGSSADTGRLVVTLEADSAAALIASINQIQQIDGVLSAALVYQCADTLDAMNEELPDAHCPT